MKRIGSIFVAGLAGSLSWLMASTALAGNFNIPGGTLAAALDAYCEQSGVQIAIASQGLQGVRTRGVSGEMSSEQALSKLLSGTGFTSRQAGDSIAIVRTSADHTENVSDRLPSFQLAQAATPRAAVETVTVTSSKLGGADVQSIPIAITALSQEQLTSTQTAGGPDLIKQVPNLTFTKTNFTGYSIQIRGIGTQAISVTTDPAVAVALNDTPFIRNHFFEQEFFDLGQAEVLRGPQGTLYGRNATAGVVNLITAKPTDQFEAMASADVGNYKNRRFEGMLNLPIVDDRFDLRIAGEWTKRDGYSVNTLTSKPIDGRDLWSSRATLAFKPSSGVQAYILWEHFQENDDRMRTAKQLCKTAPIPTEIDGTPIHPGFGEFGGDGGYLSQGCLPTSLYSPEAFEVPNGLALPYYNAFTGGVLAPIRPNTDPYASTTQSTNLRDVETTLDPVYKSKSDIVEFNLDYAVSPSLTFSMQTGFNRDSLWSTEDYNRFNTSPGIFSYISGMAGSVVYPTLLKPDPAAGSNGIPSDAMIFCDPQLGCSDRLVAQDVSSEHAWQLSQEFRLSSHFVGPLNFSIGGNYLHYETSEDYYVFINTLTIYSAEGNYYAPWVPGVSDNANCMKNGLQYGNPNAQYSPIFPCVYIDPNSIGTLNGNGHNYFRSENPYVLNSYAGFGEAYYDIAQDLKLTAGLRFTEDQKHFLLMPSWLLIGDSWGYPVTGIVDQQWDKFTGRFAANWSPKVDFTDQTLIYGSYAHGYKAGGANPPGAVLLTYQADLGDISNPIHPLTFKPEFIDAYEVGTKNTLFDGALTVNADAFYYNYKNYQISEIVDRTSINLNFDATVRGAELESTWEPLPGLKFRFAGGYEQTRVADGSHAVDLMDRTAGRPGWMVVRPFVTQASNCVLPNYVVLALLEEAGGQISFACGQAYTLHNDPVTWLPYAPGPLTQSNGDPVPNGYPGYDPLSSDAAAPTNVNNGLGLPPNNGQGFDKDLGGNELPNAPHFTTSVSAEYTVPVSQSWAATLHTDFYWQADSFARIFNDRPYDQLQGYNTTNLALILSSADGWQVLGYIKNIFNKTAITGSFLNSDDSGLTTNVFLTDPRLFGVRVTKNW